jgi:hypothetical protein
MHFLAPNAQPYYAIDTRGRTLTADENGILTGATVAEFPLLINAGCAALPPPKWVDPRKVVTVSADGKIVTVA